MKALLLAPVLLLAAAFVSTAARADPLDGLRGDKRALLLFSKSRSLSSLDRFVDLLRERRPDLSERDMVVLVTAGSDPTYSVIGYTSLSPGANRDLRRRFEPRPSGLTAVLVGKDGTEKARAYDTIDIDAILALVDQMPMRRREIEEES